MSKYNKRNTPEKITPRYRIPLYPSYFAMRAYPFKEDMIERLAEDIIQWATEDEDALVISEFIVLKNIPHATYYDWLNTYPNLKEAHTEALRRIAIRREKGIINRKYDVKATLMRMHVYDPEWRKDEEWRAANRAKAQHEAKGDSSSITFVVEEFKGNKKEDENGSKIEDK